MVVTPKDAFVALWNIHQAQKVAMSKSPDNGVILLIWSCVCVLGLASFDIFAPLTAAFVLVTLVMICAIWHFFYKRHLPVQMTKLKTNTIVCIWGGYHACVAFGSTWIEQSLFQQKPPCFFTLVGLVDVAPLLIMGLYLWKKSHAA